jgi:uncharacterized membrane protein (UPF0127 family)
VYPDTRRPRRWLMLAVVSLALAAVPAAGVAAKSLAVERLDVVTARGTFHFKVEIADTDATREKGLMFRKALAADKGMLFDFKAPRLVAFWMKNTPIPLDMLFIAADGHVVSIARDAVPLSEVPVPSGGEVLGVLELRGGRASEIGAQPGDRVRERIFHR